MIADATAWMDAHVRRTGAVEVFRERPWATILRAPTSDGPVWLKAPAPDTVFEVGLYALLERVVPQRILVPLAVDLERGWLLLPDGGEPADLETALPAYAELQRALAPHADALLALGVLDMRAAAMPARFDEAVACIEGGHEVAHLRSTFASWCGELAVAPGAASLDHNDLHDENVLAGPRFYDWGDAVVAHPFACLLVPYQVVPEDRRPAMRDAYLEVFSDLASHAELVATADLACRVAIVARALIWHRAVRSFPDADPNWTTAPLESLQALLDT
jgi:hypothetical protein